MPKLDEAKEILQALGLPDAQRNDLSALAFLALGAVSETSQWASMDVNRSMRTHDIKEFINEQYGRNYAENTRETVRKDVLQPWELAGVAVSNLDDPGRATNSPNNNWRLTPDAIRVAKAYGTEEFNTLAEEFKAQKGSLADKYAGLKSMSKVAVRLRTGEPIRLSPGKHNNLQKAIVEELAPRHLQQVVLLYLGDTANKAAFVDRQELTRLGIPLASHGKLPDIIFYDQAIGTLFLVEAVTSRGPVSMKRHAELEELLANSPVKRVYVSAFANADGLSKHLKDISWETEVWLSDRPDHFIHFDGSKFFSVHPIG